MSYNDRNDNDSSFHSFYERFETSHPENYPANRTLVRRAVLFLNYAQSYLKKAGQPTRKRLRQFF